MPMHDWTRVSAGTYIAYVEPLAVGDALIEMPLFLRPDWYVPLPLEESYQATFQGVPRRWQRVLTDAAAAP